MVWAQEGGGVVGFRILKQKKRLLVFLFWGPGPHHFPAPLGPGPRNPQKTDIKKLLPWNDRPWIASLEIAKDVETSAESHRIHDLVPKLNLARTCCYIFSNTAYIQAQMIMLQHARVLSTRSNHFCESTEDPQDQCNMNHR